MTTRSGVSPLLLYTLGALLIARFAIPLRDSFRQLTGHVTATEMKWEEAQALIRDSAVVAQQLSNESARYRSATYHFVRAGNARAGAEQLLDAVTVLVDSAGLSLVAAEPTEDETAGASGEVGMRFEATGSLEALALTLSYLENSPRLWRVSELTVQRETAATETLLRARVSVRALLSPGNMQFRSPK